MISPYGTWPSPISAALVADQGLRLSAVTLDGDDIYWLEGRPAEGGRNVLVRRTAGRRRERRDPRRASTFGPASTNTAAARLSCIRASSIFRTSRISASTASTANLARCREPITPEGAWFYADVSRRAAPAADLSCARITRSPIANRSRRWSACRSNCSRQWVVLRLSASAGQAARLRGRHRFGI